MLKFNTNLINIFNKLNFFILSVYLILLLLTINMWDAYNFDYAFLRDNLNGLKLWANENSHKCFLILINSIYFIKKNLYFNNEILFDIFNFISFTLYISQISFFGKTFFNLEKKYYSLLISIALVLPIWEGYTSLPLGFYLFYFGICLLGFRFFFYSDNKLKNIIGFTLIINSICVQSNYALISGLILCFLLNSKIDKKKIFKSIFIFTTILLVFIINYFYFPPYNYFENYNKISYLNISPNKLLNNVYNYLTFFAYFSWLILILIFLHFRNKKKFNVISFKNLLIIIILFACSTGPYLLLDKSTDIFAWKDFLSRHAYLMAIPFCFFFILIFKKIYEEDKTLKKKIFIICVSFFIMQGFTTQILKFYFKLEASIFQKSLIKNLKKFQTPKSGLVEFYRSDGQKFNFDDEHNYLPGHRLRNQEIAVIFYKAYNKAGWLFFIPKSKSEKKLNFNKYKTLFNADEFDVNSSCVTKLYFSEKLSYLERLKFFYILNADKYYNIKDLKTDCY